MPCGRPYSPKNFLGRHADSTGFFGLRALIGRGFVEFSKPAFQIMRSSSPWMLSIFPGSYLLLTLLKKTFSICWEDKMLNTVEIVQNWSGIGRLMEFLDLVKDACRLKDRKENGV